MIAYVFADTGHWIASIDKRDSLHDRAQGYDRQLRLTHRIVTTEMVLTEVLAAFAGPGETLRSQAVKAVEAILSRTNMLVVPQSSALFAEALDMYKSRPDKEYSLVDCASFKIMERMGISDAPAYDHHFVQAGFKALLREPLV